MERTALSIQAFWETSMTSDFWRQMEEAANNLDYNRLKDLGDLLLLERRKYTWICIRFIPLLFRCYFLIFYFLI